MIENYQEAQPYIPDSDIRNWVGPFQDKQYYHELGLAQAQKIKSWLNISKASSVLDIGCGCGRIALHFTNEIAEPGSYCGFDCSKNLLDFCCESLAPGNPAFSFQVLDTKNGSYNPDGKYDPASLALPFQDGRFNAALAWSVFTHMDFDSVKNYISEVHRVLSENGTFCFSMNLHDSGTLQRIASGQSTIKLTQPLGLNSYVLNPQRPEDCFTHDRHIMESAVEETGFEILESLEGWWSFGTPNGEYHDCIVCRKKSQEETNNANTPVILTSTMQTAMNRRK